MPASAYFAEMGRALKFLRSKMKVSGTAVARSAGMSKSQLSKYETGRELPRLETLARILDAIEVEPLWFFYLVHQFSRQEISEALRVDLMLLPGGIASPLVPDEEESFKRHLETLFELHAVVVKARLGGERGE